MPCSGRQGETQSDSSEASLTSLNNPVSSHRSLPPLPPRPPKRGILKQGFRISSSGGNSDILVRNDSNLLANTLQNEVIAYQNMPKKTVSGNDYLGHLRTSPGDSSSVDSADQTSSYLTPPVMTIDQDGKSPSIDCLTDSTTNSSFATPPFSLSPVSEGKGHHSFLNKSKTIYQLC